MDFIDLSPASEENCLKASKSMPVPLLPPVENFEGRLSISGDPFEKMLSQAKLHNDPFECLTKSRSVSGNSLMNNEGDLEKFLQNSPLFFSPNYGNRTFLFCDISPILNSPNPEQVSLLNNAFLQTSALPGKNFSDSDAEKIVEAFRMRIGSEPVATNMGEDERKNKSMMIQNEKEGAKVKEWHSFVSEVKEDLLAETPPQLVTDYEEDSIEDLKIPVLDQLVADEKTLPSPENSSSSPDGATINESVVDSSVVIDDLRRRMKDVLNRRITPSKVMLDVTDTTLDVPRIVRQETFNIEKESTGVSAETDGEKNNSQEEIQKIEDPEEGTFMEKLKTMCGEHNVSFVQDVSQAEKNQSMIVVYVNDSSRNVKNPSPLKRRNSFSSEIPRAATPPNVSANRRRRSVTSTAHRTDDEASREWKCPVGRVLPSPQFRGQQLKIRAGESKPRATVGPMRAIYPQPKIQVDENDSPPARVMSKKRYSVTTSTPKVESVKPKACSTPLVKMTEKNLANKAPQKRQSKHLLVENNKIRPRVSTSK